MDVRSSENLPEKRRSLRSSSVDTHQGFSPQVKNVVDQEGFGRQKRGYRNINDLEVNMSDPLFYKQWYLVSDPFGSYSAASLMADLSHLPTSDRYNYSGAQTHSLTLPP